MTLAVFTDLATVILGATFIAGAAWRWRGKTVHHWRALNAIAAFLAGLNFADWSRNGGVGPAVQTGLWLAGCVSTLAGAHYAGKLVALRTAQTTIGPKE